MSATETMIWMAGAAVLWGCMALLAVRLIERRNSDEH